MERHHFSIISSCSRISIRITRKLGVVSLQLVVKYPQLPVKYPQFQGKWLSTSGSSGWPNWDRYMAYTTTFSTTTTSLDMLPTHPVIGSAAHRPPRCRPPSSKTRAIFTCPPPPPSPGAVRHPCKYPPPGVGVSLVRGSDSPSLTHWGYLGHVMDSWLDRQSRGQGQGPGSRGRVRGKLFANSPGVSGFISVGILVF